MTYIQIPSRKNYLKNKVHYKPGIRRFISRLESEEREDKIAKEYGAVFVSKIGHPLASGKPHSPRSPDYDDWNLNGDIIFESIINSALNYLVWELG